MALEMLRLLEPAITNGTLFQHHDAAEDKETGSRHGKHRG